MSTKVRNTNLKDLKICLNQMPVIPGRPDLNTKYMIRHIEAAVRDEVDILAFPEMCVSGYLIGDLYEDQSFVQDIGRYNKQIIRAVPEGIVVIFGSLAYNLNRKNEDGRLYKNNVAIVVSGGKVLTVVSKTLQPNYRIFDDDRHFYSTRKIATANEKDVADYLEPVEIKTRIGLLRLGVILCEDMWHDDYPINPTQILVNKEAEIIFNLSASPWTWQKNRKRHQVVEKLLEISPVPFVYVNNTGVQNNGKNIIVFDGSSTVYNSKGEIILAVPPYSEGNHNFVFPDLNAEVPIESSLESTFVSLAERISHDADELYAGWECAVRNSFLNLPIPMRKAVIGLSGGIDSAVDAALLTKILGPENVYAINMPSHYNSQKTKDIAERMATNLGIHYEIRPIEKIVESICEATGTKIDTLSYENVQARVRMEILSARSQDLGAVFICNSNKIEMAFGYGTMYGDIAGFIAPLGDMLKYEVYQMGDYLNRIVYQREVVPRECFTIAPSAELKDKQTDPFHYGSLEHRGYHDELVRAFIEFRYNPEHILDLYIKNSLETEFKLEFGTLSQLFKTSADFLSDLEKNYRRFIGSYFKRIQCPPIPILSKRSFGYDLRESMLSPFFTNRYYDLKQWILSQDRPKMRIAIFGGSFNPAGKHHQEIVARLAEEFDKVIVVVCGSSRSDKNSVKAISNKNRAAIASIAFGGIKSVELDFHDPEHDTYTPTYQLEERYATKYPEAEIWHVVGTDLVCGGRDKNSQIQKSWQRGQEIWESLKFYIIARPGYELSPGDIPPVSKVCEIQKIFGSGTMIRKMIKNHEDTSSLVSEDVLSYIQDNHLYDS